MAAIDHLIFSATDLQTGVDLIADLTGVTAAPGGPHPGLGTHNALLSFDDETYFEVIAIDPAQPEPARPRPFGLDDGGEPRLAGFAIHPTDGDPIDAIAERMRDHGHDPGEIISMSRQHPDGHLIEWQLTAGAGARSTFVPFIIDWGSTPTPALSTPRMGELVSLELTHPDPGVRAVAAALDVGLVVAEGPPLLSARLATATGEVAIDSNP
ncbi:MAG: VOC family protein [Actinomycetota bacterium]